MTSRATISIRPPRQYEPSRRLVRLRLSRRLSGVVLFACCCAVFTFSRCNVRIRARDPPFVVPTIASRERIAGRGSLEHPGLPFSRFQCQGDELEDLDGPYARPFRFHVYKDMPKHLLEDVVARAEHWWKPGRSENQFILEVLLYKYLSLHPCHTDDELAADAYVVPAQTVSAVWLSRQKGPNQPPDKDEGGTYMREVMDWLQTRRPGRRFVARDHYIPSVPWWTGGRPYGFNINLIGMEVPMAFDSPESFGDTSYLRATNDIIVPYPDPDSVSYYTEERLANATRDLTAIFVGQNRVVAPVKDQFKGYNKRKGREAALWMELKNRDDIRSVKDALPRAVFGPVMPGDSISSRRLFSLLHAGTIPVIICDLCMLPYQDVLDYSKFAVFLSEESILQQPEVYDMFEVLDAIPSETVLSLQQQGQRAKRHFVYHEDPPVPGDALDMMVREMAMRQQVTRGLKEMMLRAYGEDDENGDMLSPA